MKKFLFVLTLSLFLGSFSFNSFSKDLKIGYVNIFKVFNAYDKTKKYDDMIAKEKTAKEKELDAQKKKITDMNDKLSLLKADAQKKQKSKLTEEVKKYRQMERTIYVDLKKKRDTKMKEIVNDINKVIEIYAKKKGFSYIFNNTAILYGNKKADVTDDIIKKVNEAYKKNKQ